MTSPSQTGPVVLGAAAREHVLFVHAHPDDETIATGGTIALLRMRGAGVTIITCTRGEAGEDIRVVRGDSDAATDEVRFAQLREQELRIAVRALGVADQRYLGDAGARLQGREPRRYRDTGMSWGATGAELPEAIPAGSLVAADLGEAAADIATVITEVQPTAVVSYDAYGGYGHPDHIRAHEAARHAAQVMGVPFFEIAADADATATLRIDVAESLPRKRDALTAYASQLVVEGDAFTLSNGVSHPIATVEAYRQDGVIDSPPPRRPGVWTAIAALAIGLVLGTVSVILHQQETFGRGLVGTGVVVVLALLAVVLVGARLAYPDRFIVFALVAGVMVAIGALAFTSPGGSVMVPDNAAGWALLVGPVGIAAVLLALPNTLFAPAPPRTGE